MTHLTPVIDSNYNANAAAVMQNHTYVPISNAQRPLYALATFDVSAPSQTGQTGATYINTTNNYTNTSGWFAIQILADTVFSVLNAPNWNGDSPVGALFKADHIIYGTFTEIQLASGAIVAYKL